MIPILAQAFELEESVHGPQNAFNLTTGFFLLSAARENHKLQMLNEFIQNEVHAYSCTVGGPKSNHWLDIKSIGSSFDFLEYLTIFQTLAYYLATDKGRNLSEVVYPNLNKYIQKKY